MLFEVCMILCGISLVNEVQALQMDDCLEINEPTLCYLCDSQEDQYCGDPFQYSHYYSSKDIYLIECQGCCIKMDYPSTKGSAKRIVRSCTDNLPNLNYTLEESCDLFGEQERKVCICEKELCNDSAILRGNSFCLFLIFSAVVVDYLRLVI